MINVTTGEITVESFPIKLGPSFKREDLSKLPITSKSQVVNEPFHSYSLGKVIIDGKVILVLLYFYEQCLESIELANASEEFGQTWDDWSPVKEMKRKESHDRWLKEQTGYTSHVYSWGEIDSSYDPKSGGSSITIRYSWKGQPWPQKRGT